LSPAAIHWAGLPRKCLQRRQRNQFGRQLRLIGGIDLDALRQGKAAIKREVETNVPPLLQQGGYVPLADGRVREDVPFENYVYYRQLVQKNHPRAPLTHATLTR